MAFLSILTGAKKNGRLNNKKAELKSVIRNILANDNGDTSQKPII